MFGQMLVLVPFYEVSGVSPAVVCVSCGEIGEMVKSSGRTALKARAASGVEHTQLQHNREAKGFRPVKRFSAARLVPIRDQVTGGAKITFLDLVYQRHHKNMLSGQNRYLELKKQRQDLLSDAVF